MSAPTLPSMPAATAFDRRALADFRSLAGRIDGNGPRYTSYPTADRFDAEWTTPATSPRSTPAAPTPPRRPRSTCTSRSARTSATTAAATRSSPSDHARSARYVDYLAREMAMVAGRLGERRAVMQSHWGGGTPTFLDPDEMRRVMAALTQHFHLLPEGEHRHRDRSAPRDRCAHGAAGGTRLQPDQPRRAGLRPGGAGGNPSRAVLMRKRAMWCWRRAGSASARSAWTSSTGCRTRPPNASQRPSTAC